MPQEAATDVTCALRGEAGTEAQSVALPQTTLLAVFSADHDRAKEKYWALYQKLVRYFGWNRTADPEDLAQEVFLRGLRRLRQGQEITVENPENYFFGIARNLVRESWRIFRAEQFAGQASEPDPCLFRALNRMEQLVFLKECLYDLEQEDVELIIAYLRGHGDEWARKAGMRPSTLRSRVHRARKRLEHLAVSKRPQPPSATGRSGLRKIPAE
jgi:DNA-directed RNA polymerase specialized sigma24 family protein